ncbi:MAG: amidohydrolase family protein [Chloroflexota bacterium]
MVEWRWHAVTKIDAPDERADWLTVLAADELTRPAETLGLRSLKIHLTDLDLLPAEVYVDFSGALPGRCDLDGIEFAERFLRRLGLGRALFAADYPIFACERHYTVLDRMQFTEDETEQIAYRNAAAILA